MIRSFVLAGSLVLIAASAATGEDGSDAITHADCTKPQHAQMIINHCSSLKFQTADKALSEVYERALATIKGAGNKARLEAAESTFLQYRSAQCALEAGMHDHGSVYSMVYTTCARLLTEARTKELQTFLDCSLSADLSRCDTDK